MRTDRSVEPAGRPQAGVRCGGFRIVFEEARPLVRLLPGDRQLADGVAAAVLQGLSDAPALIEAILRLRQPLRPYDRVEVTLGPGDETQGEAVATGLGSIRLALGERTTAQDAARIARHEALHLLLAASLRGGARWNDPELTFAEWVIRGIESGLADSTPRFRSPLPALFDPLPVSRDEVLRHLAADDARRYFGEPLFSDLQRLESDRQKLWLVEAALGTHYLERAQDPALRPVLLDDWLIDYEQYARALGNAPSGTGNLWRMSEGGWSRDPLTRLSAAAQALQCDDNSIFASGGDVAEPLVWKNRGLVRLPLLPSPEGPRPFPIHGFRAALRESADPQALALVEEAARGEAQRFEARALWPRILARLLAAGVQLPEGGAGPAVHLVDGPEEPWRRAADALRALAGEWAPRIEAQPVASALLVHSGPLSAASLSQARRLASRQPVRGALFTSLDDGSAYELLPDLEEPIDPRYREEEWRPGPVPARAEDLPALADEATREGRPTTPLSHLLAIMAIGLEECHYPRATRAASG